MQHEDNILKWLDGSITDAQFAALRKTEEYASLAPIIERTALFKKPSINVEDALQKFNALKKPKTKVVKMAPWKQWSAIAASFVLIASVFFVFSNNTITISTDYAETTDFLLPDASEVVVNAGSELSYSEKKWSKQRKVSLRGEAFFRVNKGKTFDVITTQGTVTVVGTQFNVRQRNDYFEVSCFEGKVKVTTKTDSVMLSQGEAAIVIDGTLREIAAFNASAPDWMRNESAFDKLPFNLVVEELERQFNVTIIYDATLSKKIFSGSFGHKDLNSALQ